MLVRTYNRNTTNHRTTKMRNRLVEPRSPKMKVSFGHYNRILKDKSIFFCLPEWRRTERSKKQNRKSNSDHDLNIGSPRLEQGCPKCEPFLKFSSIFLPRQQLRHISSKRINNVPYLNSLKRGHFGLFYAYTRLANYGSDREFALSRFESRPRYRI
jgi:hypothetical protein